MTENLTKMKLSLNHISDMIESMNKLLNFKGFLYFQVSEEKHVICDQSDVEKTQGSQIENSTETAITASEILNLNDVQISSCVTIKHSMQESQPGRIEKEN